MNFSWAVFLKRCLVAVSIIVALIVAAIVYLFTVGVPIGRYASPDGKYYVTVFDVQKNPFEIGGPGDGGWSRVVCRLYTSNRWHVASSEPMFADLSQPELLEPGWFEDSVGVYHEQYLRCKK